MRIAWMEETIMQASMGRKEPTITVHIKINEKRRPHTKLISRISYLSAGPSPAWTDKVLKLDSRTARPIRSAGQPQKARAGSGGLLDTLLLSHSVWALCATESGDVRGVPCPFQAYPYSFDSQGAAGSLTRPKTDKEKKRRGIP
jgi:hypothetical protein